MPVETFGIEKEFLKGLLTEAQTGKAQLPEFQRGWVWPMENIRSLLASISLGYPVGTIMMLRTGGEVKFKERPIEGAEPTRPAERLVLDGQQRLTSLFQALMLDRPIQTQDVRKRRLTGLFYVDMEKALDPFADREEAFVFVPEDRVIKDFRGNSVVDVSSAEHEYANGLFPMRAVFDPWPWEEAYVEHWEYDRDRSKLRAQFHQRFTGQFEQYLMPVIELSAETPRQAVCQVFEKVNTGGVTLTVFELLTATYAADEFDLRKDWREREQCWAAPEYKVLHDVSNTDFLQIVTLLSTLRQRQVALSQHLDEERVPRVGCRRTDMLNLPLTSYEKWAPVAVEGLKAAARLMHQQYIFDTKFLPYGSQLIPLAAILAVLGTDGTSAFAQQRVARWLWCGILGELYGGTTETRFARDLPEVVDWAKGGATEPRTVQEAQFVPGRLDTLRTRGSAAYKGLYALLMKQGAVDWRTGEPMSVVTYFDEYVDIHHVFPRAWCEKQRIEPHIYNSIINKTPLTARTNRVIGGWAPSEYLTRLTNSAGVPRPEVESHIVTHDVDVDILTSDDFDRFYADRRESLLTLIGTAMGKDVVRESPEEPEVVDDPDEPMDEE